MEQLREASFGQRLGAFAIDLVVVCGVWMVGGFVLFGFITPVSDRPGDPVDWTAPTAAVAMMFSMVGLPVAYAAASWSRLLGHRSVGKRLFHLRVVRDER
jgi:uncharacterized RDD family membrane protein YckC